MTTHIVKVDGYQYGDRLLDGVLFDVPIVEEAGKWTVLRGQVTPEESALNYLDDIKWEKYAPDMETNMENALLGTLAWCEEEGITLEQAMDDFAKETGEPGIQILVEY